MEDRESPGCGPRIGMSDLPRLFTRPEGPEPESESSSFETPCKTAVFVYTKYLSAPIAATKVAIIVTKLDIESKANPLIP